MVTVTGQWLTAVEVEPSQTPWAPRSAPNAWRGHCNPGQSSWPEELLSFGHYCCVRHLDAGLPDKCAYMAVAKSQEENPVERHTAEEKPNDVKNDIHDMSVR